MKQYMIFDLDGTLIDPKVGICTCVQYALESFGIEEPDLEKLDCFIGPPLKDSFKKFYDMSDEDADKAVEKYREQYWDSGVYECEVYDGIFDLLRRLKNGGMHLGVISQKPQAVVEQTLKHFKMDGYFEVTVGRDADGERTDRVDAIYEALRQFFPDGMIKYDEVYLTGDQKKDIEAAKTVKIDCVGVTYGYGSIDELKEAKADYIVQDVQGLKKFLMREVEEAKRSGGTSSGSQKKNKDTGDSDDKGKNGKGSKAAMKNTSGRTPMQILWRVVLVYLIYFVAVFLGRTLTGNFLSYFAGFGEDVANFLVIANDDGTYSFTGSSTAIMLIVGTLLGIFLIRKLAWSAIKKTREETSLSYIKKEPVTSYVITGVVSLAAVIGVTEFLIIYEIVDFSEEYQSLMESRFSSLFVLGLLCYGIVTPFAEELLFRGVVYNSLKRFMSLRFAIVLSAFIFSAYYNNAVQAAYAFVLGFILAYVYEYFGNYWITVVIHIAANSILYTLGNFGVMSSPFVNTPMCVIAIMAAFGGWLYLNTKKKVW